MLRTAVRGCAILPYAIALLGAPSTQVAAQVVHGRVIGAGSGAPIQNARLLLRDPDGEVRAGVFSAENGRFELMADLSGLVRLEVSHIGYADWSTANFALASDAVIEVEVRLGVEAIPLDPLVVVARSAGGRATQFERRMNSAGRVGGYFLTADEIDRRPVATATKLVLTAPGMSVRLAGREGSGNAAVGLDRNVIMAGDCVASTFIDGVRIDQGGNASIDDLLAPNRIAGLEMYPRGASAPLQYVDARRPQCGVVLFWTKEPERNRSGSWGTGRVAVGIGLVAAVLTLGLIR